jgi:hypothetical protein
MPHLIAQRVGLHQGSSPLQDEAGILSTIKKAPTIFQYVAFLQLKNKEAALLIRQPLLQKNIKQNRLINLQLQTSHLSF